MTKLFLLAVALGFGATLGRAADEPFSRRVTAAEFGVAGLAKLSPAELAQLDALFGKYGAAVVQPGPTAATGALQARVADAEARTRQAEQDAAAARAAQKKSEETLLTRAKKVFVPAGTKVEIAAADGEIDGAFDGWDSDTMWRLKDGTVWRVENKPSLYVTKRVMSVRVKIYPASFGGYWMEFPDLALRVRVRQVK
jgi:hypothetical protein